MKRIAVIFFIMEYDLYLHVIVFMKLLCASNLLFLYTGQNISRVIPHL